MIFELNETLSSSLKKSRLFLRSHYPETITNKEAYEIASFVFKKTKEQLIIDSKKTASLNELKTLSKCLKKRKDKYPLAYLLKTVEFYGQEFTVGPGAFIPRPETELLVKHGLDFLKKTHSRKSKVFCCDLGTGTGCISLSIAQHFPSCFFYAVESSKKSFLYLEKNIKKLKLKARVKPSFATCEEFSQHSPQQFDLVISNPPYIDKDDTHVDDSVKAYEPHTALWSKEKGLFHLKQWSQLAGEKLLSPGGFLILETGSDQRPDLESFLLSQNLWSSIKFHKDLQGRQRIATCLKSF